MQEFDFQNPKFKAVIESLFPAEMLTNDFLSLETTQPETFLDVVKEKAGGLVREAIAISEKKAYADKLAAAQKEFEDKLAAIEAGKKQNDNGANSELTKQLEELRIANAKAQNEIENYKNSYIPKSELQKQLEGIEIEKIVNQKIAQSQKPFLSNEAKEDFTSDILSKVKSLSLEKREKVGFVVMQGGQAVIEGMNVLTLETLVDKELSNPRKSYLFRTAPQSQKNEVVKATSEEDLEAKRIRMLAAIQ